MMREREEREGQEGQKEQKEQKDRRVLDSESGRFRAGFNERIDECAKQEIDGAATALLAAQEIFGAGNPCLMLAETCMTLAKLDEDETPTEGLKRTREQAARSLVEIEAERDDEE